MLVAKTKTKTQFICQSCGTVRPKWEGRCSDCGSWNSLVEEILSQNPSDRGWAIGKEQVSGETKVAHLGQEFEIQQIKRLNTSYPELDRVLGGGLVPGSLVLLGGDPGIGKSTLLLQMAGGLARQNFPVLYVSGEESLSQTGLRAERLGVKEKGISVASESRLEKILELAKSQRPQLLIVDSIQSVFLPELSSAPGSVSQVRECGARLMALAKNENISTLLVGHVTKDGNIAGPKVLEHMVDTVLSFEGDTNHQFRLLRALKNRFGPTHELGVFQMQGEGLIEVSNPSEMFLEQRGKDLTGSAVFAAMEGSRPVLCEIQALANPSPMANPRRTTLGLDSNRIHLLAAVLDKHLYLELARQDIFVNVVGGLRIEEPGTDLAVAAGLLSTVRQKEISARSCFFGEIGLTGEVRAVPFAELRINEALKLGFTQFFLPLANQKHLKKLTIPKPGKLHWISDVGELDDFFAQLPKKEKNRKRRLPREPEAIQ